ncbi:SDR family oxidoreductase [uncultured Roseibium sp.]|uniref:SDR family NAD(P)-dependent oxidoreductase n=1 Tax=uncultured Roseibium sp. TaxID=1936171 RepID=UPI002609ABB8|nr:SDR family oxidoreductase [uncultured Roseibium sp.]
MTRTAIVTGGAQGIGFACAQKLKADGARLVLWDMDEEALAAAASELDAVTVKVDLSDWDAVEKAYEQTKSQAGSPSIVVNSAGIAGPNAPVEDYPVAYWNRIMEINANGSFYLLKAVLPGMKADNYGRVVLISSVAGKEGNPNASAYSASKAAVMALAKSAGKECAGFDIAINAITPAAARTRIFDQMSEEHINYMLSKIPRNRFLEVREAANMVSFLCSPENSFTTGAVFDLSGGRATY